MKKQVLAAQPPQLLSNTKPSKAVHITRSIRKAIMLGGLTIASSATWAESQINPNELWLSLGRPSEICAKDIDQDGDVDLFKIYPSAVSLLENTGTPESPEFLASQFFSNDAGRFNLIRLGLTNCNDNDNDKLYVDIDADGDLDLFTITPFRNGDKSLTVTVKYARNDGTSEHPVYFKEDSEEQELFGLTDEIFNIVTKFQDIDNDGDKDLLTRGRGFFENIGTPEKASFIKRRENPVPVLCDGLTDELYVDLNNDGTLDVVCSSNDKNTVSFIESSHTGYLASKVLSNEPNNYTFKYYQAIDIDKDNDIDILALSVNNGHILYTNISTSSFPEFDAGRTYPSPIFDLSSHNIILADLDGDGDLDLIYTLYRRHKQAQLKFARNTGSNTNPIYEISALSPELEQCNRNIFTDSEAVSGLALVDIDADNDLDLFTHSRQTYYFCENQGDTTNPLFSPALINPFGLDIVEFEESIFFADIDGDDDQDVLMGSSYFENIGSSMAPIFSNTSQIPFTKQKIHFPNFSPAALVDLDGDGQADSVISTRFGLRVLYKGFEPVLDIKAKSLTNSHDSHLKIVLVTTRLSQTQIQLCKIHYKTKENCNKTIVLPFSAQEISLSTGYFNTDLDEDIVLAIVDTEGNLRVNVYNNNLQLIGSATGGFAQSISVSAGQLDEDPEDEGVVSFVQSDGRVAAVSFNLDASIVGKMVAGPGTQPRIAVGNFNASHDSFVLAYLSPDEQIQTATYRGNGTLISQGTGGKSSYLSLIAADILSNIEGDEYVTSIIQQDGSAGLLGFSADNILLGKVIGGVSQQPEVVSGHFPRKNDIGLAASLIQKDQRPAIIFFDSIGNHLATGIGATTASIATLTTMDTDQDSIDEGVLVYIDGAGVPRLEVFGVDGIRK